MSFAVFVNFGTLIRQFLGESGFEPVIATITPSLTD